MVLILVAIFVVTGAVSSKTIKFVDVQESERAGFSIEVEMPENVSFEETERWFLDAEDVIESQAEEFGLEGWFHFHRRTYGEIEGWFTNPRSSDLTAREVTERAGWELDEITLVIPHQAIENPAMRFISRLPTIVIAPRPATPLATLTT